MSLKSSVEDAAGIAGLVVIGATMLAVAAARPDERGRTSRNYNRRSPDPGADAYRHELQRNVTMNEKSAGNFLANSDDTLNALYASGMRTLDTYLGGRT